jgi:hypothetical protein
MWMNLISEMMLKTLSLLGGRCGSVRDVLGAIGSVIYVIFKAFQ